MVDKWPDVSQLAYGVGNHSNPVWMTTMGTPTCVLTKVGASPEISKKISCSTEIVRIGQNFFGFNVAKWIKERIV